jgi:LPS sulfotransferase NodH
MYTHHRFDHEFPRPSVPVRAYALCSVPRSGSSLLAELLCLTGVAGAPTEYFDREQADTFLDRWGVSADGYVAELVARKTSPNGRFGIKVHHHQMVEWFGERGMVEVWPDLRAIAITRLDRVAQAVSWARAEQTGWWASTHRASGRSRYDHGHIARLLARIEAEERGWADWFEATGIEPLRITYEELVGDQAATVGRVLAHLGVDPPPELPAPTLVRQADEASLAWAARFRAERGRGPETAAP